MRFAFFWLFVCTSLLVSLNSFGQYTESINSRRPGQSISASALGARVLQFQTGAFYGGLSRWSSWSKGQRGVIADALLRYGIREQFEMGFLASYSRFDPIEQSDFYEGVGNVAYALSARSNILAPKGFIPGIGLQAEVLFPDSKVERYTESIGAQFTVMIDQKLEDRINLTTNIGVIYRGSPTGFYTTNFQVFFSPKAFIFVEHVGLFRRVYSRDVNLQLDPEETITVWYAKVNGGFGIRIIKDLQIDASAGYGKWVSKTGQKDWFVSGGISWRIRFKKRAKKETLPVSG